jgi:hypothetical protein
MPTKSRIRLLRRRFVCVAAVIAAAAIVAPVAEASAQPTPAVPLWALGGWSGIGGLPSYGGLPFGSIGPGYAVAVAIDPPVIASVFNGGTTVAIATGPAVANTIASP